MQTARGSGDAAQPGSSRRCCCAGGAGPLPRSPGVPCPPGPPCRSGKYDGPEAQRLAVLKAAATGGAAYVDVELKVAHVFFAGEHNPSHTSSKMHLPLCGRGAPACRRHADAAPHRSPPRSQGRRRAAHRQDHCFLARLRAHGERGGAAGAGGAHPRQRRRRGQVCHHGQRHQRCAAPRRALACAGQAGPRGRAFCRPHGRADSLPAHTEPPPAVPHPAQTRGACCRCCAPALCPASRWPWGSGARSRACWRPSTEASSRLGPSRPSARRVRWAGRARVRCTRGTQGVCAGAQAPGSPAHSPAAHSPAPPPAACRSPRPAHAAAAERHVRSAAAAARHGRVWHCGQPREPQVGGV